MDEDSNDIFQKINSILENPEMSDNLKNILDKFSSSNTKSETANQSTEKTTLQDPSPNTDERNTSEFDFANIDFETILKIKKIIDSLNSSENDSRSNLLLSLKPYVADNKKQKIDQYIKLLNIAKVLDIFNPLGGEAKHNE